MAIKNLTNLKTELDAWAKRTIGSQVDQFITLAEKRIVAAFAKNGLQNKLVNIKTLTAANSMSAPAGCRSIEAMYIDANPKKFLDYFAPAAFFTRYISTETGEPKGYTLQGKVIHLGPLPDDTYSIKCWFRQDLDITRTLDQLLIPDQSEADYAGSPATEGTFAGGTGHAAGDVITLASGAAQVTVEAVSAGVVTEFHVTEVDHTDLVDTGDTLSQSATTGSGVSFALTLGVDNISNLVLLDHEDLYLYACLLEAFIFYRNDKEMDRYGKLFGEAVSNLEEEAFNMGGAMKVYNPQASAGAPATRR